MTAPSLGGVTIRPAFPDDAAAVARLAALDSACAGAARSWRRRRRASAGVGGGLHRLPWAIQARGLDPGDPDRRFGAEPRPAEGPIAICPPYTRVRRDPTWLVLLVVKTGSRLRRGLGDDELAALTATLARSCSPPAGEATSSRARLACPADVPFPTHFAARALAAVLALLAAAGGTVACGGSSDDGVASTATTTEVATADVARGETLFAERCSGCHTLSAAGMHGSAQEAPDAEPTDGVNFDWRKVDEADVLHAIRNGGFGSSIMPANIVVGDDAAAVAAFVAKASGSKVADTPDAALESPSVRKMRAPATGTTPPVPATTASSSDPAFLRASFDSASDLWQRQFAAAGARYAPPRLVFFSSAVDTPCGQQPASAGPFYCPLGGGGVFLNPRFFAALARTFGIHSGFAGGYVVAHEVGHHVQQLLGLHQRLAEADHADPGGANRRSVAVELQADCYAGVWLHDVASSLTAEDLRQIVQAAAVVGDDFQRNRAGVALAPETWTHGSSEQRVRWLSTGKESGTPAACDTFTTSGAAEG